MFSRIFIGIVTVVTSAAMAGGVFGPPPKLPWKSELNSELCGGIGTPIVNVRQAVENDVDSGTAGNFWAYDNYVRRIKVWKTGVPNTFCATVEYKGKFSSIIGQTSPGGATTLIGNEHGKMRGGYRATIVGAFHPTLKTKGSIGFFDYQCDIFGNCPGRMNWVDKYFTSASTNLDWWGWIYTGGKYGTWINAISGNEGDIIPATVGRDDHKNNQGEHKGKVKDNDHDDDDEKESDGPHE